MNQPSSPLPSDVPSFIPPKWVSWLIALVPVFPPLYLAAFGCLSLLRTLPLTARYVLFFFASTQLVAALFTPRPLLSLGLAAARTLLILAMVSAGVYLRDSRNLRPLLWGQLIIFATAWGYTLYTQGFAGVQARLGHPYYYVVSLGLVAVVTLWITIFWKGGILYLRVLAGIFALSTFVASGSRGPLLALVVGSIAVTLSRLSWRGSAIILSCSIMLGVALSFGPLRHFAPAQRLINDQLSGRNYVWNDALNAWRGSIMGGVGPYQGGPYLVYLYKDTCQLTPTLTRSQIGCPSWLSQFRGAWLIAHNAWLHWLMETGIIGFLGFLAIYIYGSVIVVMSKDKFSIAIFFGYAAMNIVDVVVAVPSLHFAELWWTIIGISARYTIQIKGSDFNE